jgi:organic hydroperoxide reductase OsmC/OhrA
MPIPRSCSPLATPRASTVPSRWVAGKEKVDVSHSAVTARVGIGPDGKGGFGLKVDLEAELPDVERAVAEDLMA